MRKRSVTVSVAVLFLGLIWLGCGREQPLSSGVEPPPVAGLAKLAVGAGSADRAAVVAIVTRDGVPVKGVEVALSRSVSGQVPDYRWKGTTDADGQAEIEITTGDGQFWRMGASGYYLVRATDAVSASAIGQWGSIPIDGGSETVLTLPIGGAADVQPLVTVMTRNLYLGADINRILQPADPTTPIPVLVAQTWAMVQKTDFPGRAKAIADEIAAARPHLIGLQEVSLFRIQNPGDFLTGNPARATAVAVDFLAVLLAELDARGLAYRAVAIAEGIDIELPLYTGPTTPMADIRMTDREVILARSDVQTAGIREGQFQAKVPMTLGGVSLTIPRAWASVEATFAGRTLRFATAHLEMESVAPIQRLQAGELIQAIRPDPAPVVLLGDFNSAADGSTTGTYGDLTGAGFVDVWGLANPGEAGYTGSQTEDLLNTPSALNRRVDLIFVRGADTFTVLKADVVGEAPADRTPSGMWPSDHAGVVASLGLRRQ